MHKLQTSVESWSLSFCTAPTARALLPSVSGWCSRLVWRSILGARLLNDYHAGQSCHVGTIAALRSLRVCMFANTDRVMCSALNIVSVTLCAASVT
jgi:hypothetical protein